MAQEFLIRLWCDRHAAMEQQVEGSVSVPLSLPGFVGREIDLCTECHAELILPLLEVVELHGRPAGQQQPAQPPAKKPQTVQPALGEDGVTCPVCPSWYARNDLMTQHYRNVHGPTLGGIQELFGNTCPICNGEFGNLGVHANRTHGESGAAGAFRTAELQGDPHGVVRALQERVTQRLQRATR